jgi:DNA repair exonuclease SbcCD ATPase subunit
MERTSDALASSSRELARASVLEHELRALQASERASRARETALVCALDEARRRGDRERRELEASRASVRALEDDNDSLRRRLMVNGDSHSEIGRMSANDAVLEEEVGMLRERCRAAEQRAESATRHMEDLAKVQAEERERAIALAIDKATRASETSWREEMEDLARTARSDARALSSSRRRAADLTAELNDALQSRDDWRQRAEAAMEASESSSQALVHMQNVMEEMQRRSTGLGLGEDERAKLIKRVTLTQEQLQATQHVADMREAEHDKVRLALQKAHERIEATNSWLAEAKAEAEHAKETLSLERAEKERLAQEAAYLRNEVENIQTSTQDEVDAFNTWRVQSEETEKELTRKVQEAQRDAARHAMTVRKLQQKLAYASSSSPSIEEYRMRIAELEEDFATTRAQARDAMLERDALKRQVENLRRRAVNRKTTSTPPSRMMSPSLLRSESKNARSKMNAFTHQTLIEHEHEDEDMDSGDVHEGDEDDSDAFDVATESLFQETVDEFFEDADAEDARLDIDHAHAYALAKRLQSLESRAVDLLWRDKEEDVWRRGST